MTRIGLVLLLFLSIPTFAAETAGPIPFIGDQGLPVDSVAVPPQSPVHFAGWRRGDDPAALFGGRFLLTGTYYYGDGEYNDGPDFLGEAAIFPDDARNLPQFVRRNGKHAIVIDNPESFAAAVIPAEKLRRVRRKNGGYANGHVAIWVDGFTASISCDAPSYGTHFVSVYAPPKVRLASTEPSIGC